MVKGSSSVRKHDRFAVAPWTKESEAWLALDRRLSADHLARQVDRAVEVLDLHPLCDSYLGAGKPPLPPKLLLKFVLCELQNNRPSPAQWTRDAREYEPARWLLFGLEPSRSQLYGFRDRIAPFLQELNAQVLQVAVEQEMTSATRAALDGTSVAAHASRRGLLNEERLEKRRGVIDQHLIPQKAAPTTTEKVGWLAKTEAGRRVQKSRYQRAAEVLAERRQANLEKQSSKRKPAEKILVSATDPEAVLTRDKLGVFRALYNVQVLRDLDSPLILSYDLFAQNNDNGVLEPMIERAVDNVGCKPAEVLVDSGYVSIRHLEFCQQAGIQLFGPVQENDYSEQNGKKTQCNGRTELPKSEFKWLKAEQTYQCPEGHRLQFSTTQRQKRTDHTVMLSIYSCPPEHCQACPRQAKCTSTPQKGRSVSRMENEALLDELRERMQTDEAKAFYKLRSQTVELTFAALKEHRGLRRFHGRGQKRALAEVGLLVLANNLHAVEKNERESRDRSPQAKPTQTRCAA